MAEDAAPEIAHEVQVTPAHVLEAVAAFKREANLRFDTLEGTVNELRETVEEAGLNGHTPYLKAFLEQYAASYTTRQAWQTVRGDIAHRFRWLTSPKGWLKFLLAAAVGGTFTGFASTGHMPHIPGLF